MRPGYHRYSPLYEVHCVKRYLLRANAVCWTKSGSASQLSGRRSAAPPCIRSALTGDLTTIPRAWAMRGRESGTHLCNGTLALGGHRSTLVPLRREQPAAATANLVRPLARRLPANQTKLGLHRSPGGDRPSTAPSTKRLERSTPSETAIRWPTTKSPFAARDCRPWRRPGPDGPIGFATV